MTQQFLPGFEFMSEDDKRRAKDAELAKQLTQAQRDYTALQDNYSSPFKLIEYENRIQSLIKQRKELWQVPQKN